MNKHELQAQIKSTGLAYVMLLVVFGAYYAYMGRWGLQILYWITLGGCGIWSFVLLFLIPGEVQKYNANIYRQIDEIEKKEKEESHARNIAMAGAVGNSNNNQQTHNQTSQEPNQPNQQNKPSI